MIYKKWFAYIAISLGVFACAENNKQNKPGDMDSESYIRTDSLSGAGMASSIIFKARGTEPFWYLELSVDGIFLKTPEDSIRLSKVGANDGIGDEEGRYSAAGDQGSVELVIKEENCTNAMSGEESPYKVLLEYSMNTQEAEYSVEGCGSYVANPKLQGKWRLISLDKATLDSTAFSRGLPELQISTEESSFVGFAGCNQFGGQLGTSQEGVEFTAIRATKMACPNLQTEQQFLKGLESVKNSTIRNNILLLQSADGIVLEFRKKE